MESFQNSIDRLQINTSLSSTEGSLKSDDEVQSSTLETSENSNELEECSNNEREFISSKKISKIAKSMFKDCDLSYKAPLDIEDFTLFMNKNVCFKNFVLKSLKKDLWSNESY